MNQPYTLRPGLNPQHLQLVASANAQLSKDDIEIQKGEYSSRDWSRIFSSLQSVRARKLSFYSNDAPIHLHSVLSPQFTSLIELYLNCNLIASIEALVRMDSPNLEEIALLSNLVTEVRSLRKAGFTRLKFINLSNNPIRDPSSLAELSSRKLQELHLERWANNPMIGESKRWAVKLYPSRNQLTALTMKSLRRRPEIHIDKMIAEKYPAFKPG